MLYLLACLSCQDFVRLTPPLPETHYLDATSASFAPGERILHTLGSSLYVQPRAGGTPVLLLENVEEPWVVSASTNRVVAPAFDANLEHYILQSRALDGSGQPFHIGIGEPEPDFALTPDGQRVVYRELSFGGRHSLLFGKVSSADLRGIVFSRFLSGFRILPTGDGLVFRGEITSGVMQLWRAPLSPSPTPVLVSGPTVPGGNVEPDFELTPDGARVVFRGDLAQDGHTELWSASTATGVRTQLSASAVPLGSVRSFRLTPDGSRVLYAGDQRVSGVRELFSVPVDGSAPPVRISPALVLDGDVLDGFVIDPTSTFVAFRVRPDANHCTLYTAPVDGSSPALRQWREDGADGIAPDFRFFADGQHLAARVVWANDVSHGLFQFDPRRERSLQTLINVLGVLDYELGRDFVIARVTGDGRVPELWRSSLDSFTPTRLLPPMPEGHEVAPGYRLSPDQRSVVFSADPRVRGAFELFQVAARRSGRPRSLTPKVPSVSASLDFLESFEVHGDRAIYRAPAEREDFVGLYSVPLDASAPPVPLTVLGVSPGGIETSKVVGERVVFVQGGSQEPRGLYSAFLDGRAPATRLDRPEPGGSEVLPRFQIAAGQGRVLFVTHSPNPAGSRDIHRLWSAPIDGSAPARPGSIFSVLPTFELTSDERTVVYAGTYERLSRYDLWAARTDILDGPVLLARKQIEGGDVRAIRISPDDRTVVFLADLLQDEVFELFSVPIDGSAQPRRLNGPLVPGGDVGDFAIDPIGQRVVFLAEQEVEGETELYSVPIDASQAPTKLSPQRQFGTFNHIWNVGRFTLAANGEVAFLSTRGNDSYWLHSAPIDGSGPARWLDPQHATWWTSFECEPTRDGSRVVYRMVVASGNSKQRPGLFSVPIDGSRPPAVLNTPTALGRYLVADDGTRIFYEGRDPATSVHSFYEVPVDGPRDLSLELAHESANAPRGFAVLAPGLVYSDGRALWSLR